MFSVRFKLLINNLLKSILLFSFSFLIFSNIRTGRINLFIHPRFLPLIKFTCVVLFILALAEVARIFTRNNEIRGVFLKPSSAMVFAIPLFFSLVLQPIALDAGMVQQKGGLDPSIQKSLNKTAANSVEESFRIQEEQEPVEKPEAVNKEAIIELTDKNFVAKMDDIYTKPQEMIGRVIKLKGFVFKPDGAKDKEFAIVRYVISCCVADALPAGILCLNPEGKEFKTNDWYEITGEIVNGSKSWEGIPALRIMNYKKIQPLPDPYVYPYGL